MTPKGITIRETSMALDGSGLYPGAERFFSDSDLERMFGDTYDSMVLPLLRRAQAAEAELEKLKVTNE